MIIRHILANTERELAWFQKIKIPGCKLLWLAVLVICLSSCTNVSVSLDESLKDSAETKALRIQNISSPADTSSAEPYLFSDSNGQVCLSWIEKKSDGHALKFSSLQDGKWTAPIQINKGNNWFVNWADYPVIAANGRDKLMAHFLEKSDKGTYTYDVKLVSSVDSGKTWSGPTLLHDDGRKAEHGFVSIIPYGENYFVSWLDGRNTVAENAGHEHSGHGGAMSLRAAIVNQSGKKISEWELDNRVCDCCQTHVAITSNGPVVIYRDRSEDEIRDISIIRWVEGKWTAPQKVNNDNWKIDGCPVNGPRISAIGNHLAVAWFSSPEKSDQVNIVFSSDGGASFTSPIRIDEGKAIGRVDLELLVSSSAIVSWMESGEIKARIVNNNGEKEIPFVVANSSAARSGGFPQLTKSGESIIFAWTDDKEKRIKTVKIVL